jgi:hypothetical protein
MGPMSMGNGHASVPATGMSMTGGGGHGATNILPSWLAVIWTVVFVAIFVIHARHALDSDGQRRLWHAGHVLMAFGMVFMYAPSSIDRLDIPNGFWQLAFAGAAVLIVVWMLVQAVSAIAINALWLLMAIDLSAMVYMWSPNAFKAPLTWLLVVYFMAQALLWVSDRIRSVDGHTLPGGLSVTPEGAVGTVAAAPLICYRDLRVTMGAMTFGMAYMFAATQLLM